MLSTTLFTILYLAFGVTVRAQDLGVPLSWRKDDTSIPRSGRITKAQAGINQILTQLDSSSGQFSGIGYWQSANVWSAVANTDWISQGKTYQSQVLGGINAVAKVNTALYETNFNDDAQWWGTAAIYAHRAYGDANMLTHAINCWNTVSQFVISPANAASGTHPKKNFPIKGTCGSSGATMAGGVFWQNTQTDTAVNAITTGLYVALSSFLAEITGDSKYTNAAILSAQWIRNQDYNTSSNLVLDTVDAKTCATSPPTWLFTYNSGKFIEGLSVLSDVTGDAQWRNLMTNNLAAAVKSSAWEGSDGVITESSDSAGSNNDGIGFKAIFIRGLYEAFSRSPSQSALQILVHSYVDVQYNALIDLASSGNNYSGSWVGPPPAAFNTWGQLAALDVLGAAVGANAN